MDFSYNKWNINNNNKGKSLEEIGAVIFRGSKSKKELSLSKKKFLHTTDINKISSTISLKQNKLLDNTRFAIKGDIIIPRVGKRCLGRVLLVNKGRIMISDYLYVIRVSELYRESIYKSLKSSYGQGWIQAHAHGVCAKVISKTDLSNFQVLNIKKQE